MKSNTESPIYLDYNATTPLDPRVARVMIPYLEKGFGNPSSTHVFGLEARVAIEAARAYVAELIGAEPDEIIFTSGGSEANNLAIRGVLSRSNPKDSHIITSAFEHPAVSEVCRHLERSGVQVTRVPVSSEGFVDPAVIASSIRRETKLITLMHANNEIGSVQPISEIAALARERGIFFHSDAAQTIGKIPADVDSLGVDLLTIAGHKFYAPKGVGALYIRRGVALERVFFGADHEHGLRPGTENVLEIVGLGEAARVAAVSLEEEQQSSLREEFFELLCEKLNKLGLKAKELIRRNSPSERCLPNTLHISIRGVEAEALLSSTRELAVSTGAACHAEDMTVSPTLLAIGVPQEFIAGSIRISLGRMTTEAEIHRAAHLLAEAIADRVGEESGVSIESDSSVRLTSLTAGLGCGCKLRPQLLSRLLSKLKISGDEDPKLLSGFGDFEDAAVYDLGEDRVLIQSVDFFTPVVDDPYMFGSIAAANALSDIYAMGATPSFALSIACLPSSRLPEEALLQVLQGASDKCSEAGVVVAGGHSIEDAEPKFGLVVSGFVSKSAVWRNSGAQVGDALVLTKPIGTGILTTALKRGALSASSETAVTQLMAELNATASSVMRDYPVNACTDVTGFGLLGHLLEICRSSDCGAEVHSNDVPLLPETLSLIQRGILPGGTSNNEGFTTPFTSFASDVSPYLKNALNDAQTSGGLLFSVPSEFAGDLCAQLNRECRFPAVRIGQFVQKQDPLISVF